MDDKNQQGVQPTPPVVGGQADTAMPTAPLGGVQPVADKQTPPTAVPTPAPVTPISAPTEEVTPAGGEVSASQVADQVMDQKADFGQPGEKSAEDTTPQVPTEPVSAK